LAAIANVDFPTNAVIRYGAVADIRDAAAKCHASQGGASLSGGWLAPLRRLVMAKEIYMRAYPPANGKWKPTCSRVWRTCRRCYAENKKVLGVSEDFFEQHLASTTSPLVTAWKDNPSGT
jgi:hypothetical protein